MKVKLFIEVRVEADIDRDLIEFGDAVAKAIERDLRDDFGQDADVKLSAYLNDWEKM